MRASCDPQQWSPVPGGLAVRLVRFGPRRVTRDHRPWPRARRTGADRQRRAGDGRRQDRVRLLRRNGCGLREADYPCDSSRTRLVQQSSQDAEHFSWLSTDCSNALYASNLAITHGFSDPNVIDVSALGPYPGSTFLKAGKYTDVAVDAEGTARTLIVSSDNSTQSGSSHEAAHPHSDPGPRALAARHGSGSEAASADLLLGQRRRSGQCAVQLPGHPAFDDWPFSRRVVVR